MDKIIDLDTGWDLLEDILNKEIDKPVKSVMAKRVTGTLDGSGCFGCPPNGDGTTVKGEPDRRCKGDGADKGGAGKTPKASTSVTQKNNIPESADTYNEIPSSEWSKEVDTNSLPTATNSHERYMNAIMTDPESIYLDPPASKTLQDAIGRYGSATGPNGQEVLVVDWAKKLKFK